MKIIVLQFRTDHSLQHERECFEKNSPFSGNELEFINVADSTTEIPNKSIIDRYDGIIIAGSAQFDLTKLDSHMKVRINTLKPLVQSIIENDFPSLFICFGHQIGAYVTDGTVESVESSSEAGTFEVYLNDEGQKARIFKDVPKSFYVVQAHKDSVTKIPSNARHLASSTRCVNQSYQIGENIFSVQFHPEIAKEDLLWRLSMYPEYLKGRSLDEIEKDYKDTPYASKVLNNFRDIANKL